MCVVVVDVCCRCVCVLMCVLLMCVCVDVCAAHVCVCVCPCVRLCVHALLLGCLHFLDSDFFCLEWGVGKSYGICAECSILPESPREISCFFPPVINICSLFFSYTFH